MGTSQASFQLGSLTNGIFSAKSGQIGSLTVGTIVGSADAGLIMSGWMTAGYNFVPNSGPDEQYGWGWGGTTGASGGYTTSPVKFTKYAVYYFCSKIAGWTADFISTPVFSNLPYFEPGLAYAITTWVRTTVAGNFRSYITGGWGMAITTPTTYVDAAIVAPLAPAIVQEVGGAVSAANYRAVVTAVNLNGETVASPYTEYTMAASGNMVISWSAVVGASAYWVYGAISGAGTPYDNPRGYGDRLHTTAVTALSLTLTMWSTYGWDPPAITTAEWVRMTGWALAPTTSVPTGGGEAIYTYPTDAYSGTFWVTDAKLEAGKLSTTYTRSTEETLYPITDNIYALGRPDRRYSLGYITTISAGSINVGSLQVGVASLASAYISSGYLAGGLWAHSGTGELVGYAPLVMYKPGKGGGVRFSVNADGTLIMSNAGLTSMNLQNAALNIWGSSQAGIAFQMWSRWAGVDVSPALTLWPARFPQWGFGPSSDAYMGEFQVVLKGYHFWFSATAGATNTPQEGVITLYNAGNSPLLGFFSAGSAHVFGINSAGAISGRSGFLNSLTVGTVISAASYQNSPKFPTPYYTAPADITAYSQGPNAVSSSAVPDANYSGFIVGAISGNYRAGHDAPVFAAVYAYLDDGTQITLFADSAESHVGIPMLLTDWSVMASCGDQPGRYIAKVMFYATIATSGHLSTGWSFNRVWAYQF